MYGCVLMNQYTHSSLGQEVKAAAGHYLLEAEKRVAFQGREVLFATGCMAVDSSCCGTGGRAFAIVPGYVVGWKVRKNEKGELISEVEPIRDEQARQAVREIILKTETVQQVNFW